MPSVIISRNSQLVSVSPLETRTVIGRSPANDIVLDTAGISRVHACIEQEQNQFYLIDQSSTNGTFINEQRIDHQLLQNGTSFRIVDYLLTYVEDIHHQEKTRAGLTEATLVENRLHEMSRTIWLTQNVLHKNDLQLKVSRLLNLTRDLFTAADETDQGALVLESLIKLTGAKRGVLALKSNREEPVLAHIKGFDLQNKGGIKISRTILRTAIENETVVFLHSADKDRPTDSVFEIGIKSVLCVPMITDKTTIGCLYLDHPERAGVFSQTDRDLLVAAADHIAEVFSPSPDAPGHLACDDERLSLELKQRGIIARSPKTLKVFQDSQTIARYDISVLIFGETGTGKEIISRYIHDQSGRPGRFIARNCSAIAASMLESELFGHEKGAFTGATERKPGIMELADQGTLFLDEIGDMPPELQAKMLRALQEREVWRVGGSAPVPIDVRIIAATHKDIKSQRDQLNFRDDLYYRLANVEITAPSLRERPEDIAPLCDMILASLSESHPDEHPKLTLSSKALQLLEAYDWPGNIRELRNTLIQISLRCDGMMIEPRHLKGLIDLYNTPCKPTGESLPSLMEIERVHIIKALNHTKWNKSAAAKVLAIDRNRLNRRIKKLGIDT